jgi:hypothetical protein
VPLAPVRADPPAEDDVRLSSGRKAVDPRGHAPEEDALALESSTAQPLGQSSAAQTSSGLGSSPGVHGEATSPGLPSTGPA